jgi:general secretion pathway protein G
MRSRFAAASPAARRRGFTLIEVCIGIAIFAILSVIATTMYQSSQNSAKVARAEGDIMTIATAIGRYNTVNNQVPPDLATIGMDTLVDPWGNPYVYQSFVGLAGKGQMRKDKNLNPINTQYDLYSMGADGQSKMPLTAKVSQDDVILAFDGNYIGLASNF